MSYLCSEFQTSNKGTFMKPVLLIVTLMATAMTFAQNAATPRTPVVRMAEVVIHGQYWQEYLEAAHKVAEQSVEKEPGVICIFPMQINDLPCTIRIVEIYRDTAAYQSHLQTPHFLEYKQGTLHMVQSLKLLDTTPLAPEIMPLVFKKHEHHTL